jgi:predicted RNA-binding Zn-ribbon protein involved in translation (DUF1610 family)
MARNVSRGTKEYDGLQRVRHENQELKKQIKQLRKRLARMSSDDCEAVKELQREQDFLEEQMVKQQEQPDFMCDKCGAKNSYKRVDVSRRDGRFYINKCLECGHKSKMTKVKIEQ